VTASLTAARTRHDPPAARPVFPALDSLRAIGALAVVATHTAFQTGRVLEGPFSAALARLDSGVALFFVLSGFLLFRPLAAAAAGQGVATPVRRYLWRRALRIVPGYWLVVVACMVLLPQNRGARFSDWLLQVSFTQVYGLGLQRHGLTQMWSICTEVAFYLVLPLIGWAALGRRGRPWRPGRALAVIGLAVPVSVGWMVLVHTAPGFDVRLQAQWLPWSLPWFAVGMGLAVVHVQLRTPGAAHRWRILEDLGRAPGTCLAMALAVFALATTPISGPRSLEALPVLWESMTKGFLYSVMAGFLVLPAVFGPPAGPVQRILAWTPLRRLGDISYGIFLWHLLVLETVVRVLDQPLFTGGWAVTFGLTVAGTVVIATLAHVIVDRPARRWRNLF
jgi:peptidoglycan/LPS O-acetylase OafA/YrhL